MQTAGIHIVHSATQTDPILLPSNLQPVYVAVRCEFRKVKTGINHALPMPISRSYFIYCSYVQNIQFQLYVCMHRAKVGWTYIPSSLAGYYIACLWRCGWVIGLASCGPAPNPPPPPPPNRG